MQSPPAHRRLKRLAPLLVLLSCGRGQLRDQADFWQEALPPPIAVLEPWLSTPAHGKPTDEAWTAHVIETTPFVNGPEDATGANWTVRLVDGTATERRLHLGLPLGTAVPLFRNETVIVRTFARLGDDGAALRSVIVSARRPLGTGADFKPVLIVSVHDELIAADALPKLLTGMTRTEQVAYREARKGEGDCPFETTHFLVNVGPDARAVVGRRRLLYAPGARFRRQDAEAAYDVVVHDASRTSVAPCPAPDRTALAWSAVWVGEDAKAQPRPTATLLEVAVLPAAATPSSAVPTKPPARKPRKGSISHEDPPREHPVPRP